MKAFLVSEHDANSSTRVLVVLEATCVVYIKLPVITFIMNFFVTLLVKRKLRCIKDCLGV